MSETFGVTCKNGLPRPENDVMWLENQCELVTKQTKQGVTIDRLWNEHAQRNGQPSSGQAPNKSVGPMCDDSPTNAPASCSNAEAPTNGSKGAGWRDTLPSGEANTVVCRTGLTPNNNGKNTCLNGELTSAKCLPSPCVDVTKPSNGYRGPNWQELLPSGETNSIACNEGYEPTNGGNNVCTMGALNTAMCMRKPNWIFREMESCFLSNGSEIAISMSNAEDVNQMVKDCKANCIARQCNIAAIAPSNRMCYLRFAPVNSSTPVDEQIVCLPQNDQSSWLLANKTYPTSLSCTTITPPKNGRNGPDCTTQLKHGEKCSQSCNSGFAPLIGAASEGVCDNGLFAPITCTNVWERIMSLSNTRTHFGNLATTAPETVVHAVMDVKVPATVHYDAAKDVKVHAPVYVRSDNPHSKKQWGCQIQGTDARSSTNDRKSVEALCTENAQCLGYYDGGPWFIATDTDPVKCTNRGGEVYPYFYKKMTHEQRYPQKNKVTLPLSPLEAMLDIIKKKRHLS